LKIFNLKFSLYICLCKTKNLITPINIIALILAYLIGSIPTAVWIGKFFFNLDVREHGSGNAGATNSIRVLGKKAGIPVLIIDVCKGMLAVSLSTIFGDFVKGGDSLINLQIALGISAFLGHLYPIYVGFRGGKGVATMLGIIIALNYPSALLAVVVFIIVFVSFKYVSLSAIIAAYSYPVFVLAIYQSNSPTMVIFSLLVAVLITITHQKNIERLANKKEAKLNLFKSKLQTTVVE
jgi:acyl phosphate:glycerol-3-phosphate acyltransferase